MSDVSEERFALVNRALEAFSGDDIEALLATMSPDIEGRPLASVWPKTYHGHEGVAKWWRDVSELWETFGVEVDSLREVGERVLIVGRYVGRPLGTVTDIQAPLAGLVTFDGDRASAISFFLDEAQALAAAEKEGP